MQARASNPCDTSLQAVEFFVLLLAVRLPDDHRKDFVSLTTDFRTLRKSLRRLARSKTGKGEKHDA